MQKLHKQQRKEIHYQIECFSKIKIRAPPKKNENKELRKKFIEEYTDMFDLATFYFTSKMYQKDTGRFSYLGQDRHGNKYCILGRNWARLFIEMKTEEGK